MGKSERRFAPRFDCRLSVSFRNRESEILAETVSIGRHGVFVETRQSRQTGELLQLQIRLPDDVTDPPLTVRMMSVVTWTLSPAEAEQKRRPPGMGMKFYMIGARDKAAWDAYLDNLEDGARSKPLELPPPSAVEGPVRFLLRPRNLDQLRAFGAQELLAGKMFLRSPLLRRLHEVLELVVIHPRTEEEFALPARVVRLKSDGPILERGMELELTQVDLSTRQEFADFVTGSSRQEPVFRVAAG